MIDIGCARYGNDYSIERLINEFHPKEFYGFDPHPSLETVTRQVYAEQLEWEPTLIAIERAAAWVYDGEIGFFSDGLSSRVSEEYDEWKKVRCFDLAKFLRTHDSRGQRTILKIDAEGAEYQLLKHLIDTFADELLELALIEWHCPDCGRGGAEQIGHRPGCSEPSNPQREDIEKRLGCEYQEWRW